MLRFYINVNDGVCFEDAVYGYTDANWKDKLTSYNGQTITYDEIGNPLTYRDGIAFTWQHGRELATFSKAGTNATYHYNDSGIRVKKVVNGVETEYYLNGSTILTQITGDDRLDFLYDDTESLLGFLYDGESYYYVKNLQGDIIGILDSNGSQVVEYAYDAWGKAELVSGTMSSTLGHLNPFRYRGYYYDEESGLYYLNSRYYDPETCRVINADGLIYAKEALPTNLYKYCDNNPINNIDLDGYWTFGFNANINALFGIGISYSIGVYWDGYGNLVVQTSNSDFTDDSGGFGLFSIGAGIATQATVVDTVYDLEGTGLSIGGSIGAPAYLGVDVLFLGDNANIGSNPNAYPQGLECNVGIGAGIDGHAFRTQTHTISGHLRSLVDQVDAEIGLTPQENQILLNAVKTHPNYTYADVKRAANYYFPLKI